MLEVNKRGRGKKRRRRVIWIPKNSELKRDMREGDICGKLDSLDKRSKRAKAQDFRMEANTTLPLNLKNIDTWSREPNHVDLAGVDSPIVPDIPDVSLRRERSRVTDYDLGNFKGRGVSGVGRRAVVSRVKKNLGQDSDLFDLNAEFDSELTLEENLGEIERMTNPTLRDLNRDIYL